jgi:hypothetical protein
MAEMLNFEMPEFNERNEKQTVDYVKDWAEVRGCFPKGFFVTIGTESYYPHVYLRDEAPCATGAESIITYDKLSEEEQTQAKVMVTYLKMQKISVELKDVYKIARPIRVIHSALIGRGSDLASFITAPEVNLAWPMTVTKVEHNQDIVRIVCSTGTAGEAGRCWKHKSGLVAFIIKPPLVNARGQKKADNWICTPQCTLVGEGSDLMGRTLVNGSDAQAVEELVDVLLQNCQLTPIRSTERLYMVCVVGCIVCVVGWGLRRRFGSPRPYT